MSRAMKSARSTQPRPSGLFVGLATIDVIYTVDDVPRRNQKISVPEQLIVPGGPATNATATTLTIVANFARQRRGRMIVTMVAASRAAGYGQSDAIIACCP